MNRKPAKTQHASTRKRKRNNAPTEARPATSTLADLQEQVSALTREVREDLDHYLSPAMERYFARKLPDLDRDVRRQRIAECLKGLVLMQLSPGPILFSQAIDNIWHYWILETAEYAALCAALPGGEFIHHSSDDYQPEEDVAPQAPSAGVADRVVAFFAMYVGKFGLFDEGRLQYWPALAVLMEAQGWTLARTNAYLEQRAKALEAALSQISLLHSLQP